VAVMYAVVPILVAEVMVGPFSITAPTFVSSLDKPDPLRNFEAGAIVALSSLTCFIDIFYNPSIFFCAGVSPSSCNS
jgi:hypothetical protein